MVRAVKGMNDVLPGASEGFLDTAVWERVFAVAGRVLDAYGFRRVWLPIVEETDLFARGIGEQTDIVSKEMYSFEDRGGRHLTLRPEGTASAVRAYIEHNFAKRIRQQRWWYRGPMFRAESPQKGRYRQFYQIGAEFFGVAGPGADAEMLQMLWRLCRQLGLADVTIRLNTLGDGPSRENFGESLRRYLLSAKDKLCDNCRQRAQANPLRVLDCKQRGCGEVVRDAPDILPVLTEDARQHFDTVQQRLTDAGVPFVRDPKLVRGLDYYTGTLFELTTTALGAQDAILGGGRYDGLVEALGGPSTPAVGFAAGVERLALLLAEQGVPALGPDLYIAPMPGAEGQALTLADEVRNGGPFRIEVDVGGGRVKHQVRRADRAGARWVLILGDEELASGRGKLKDLRRPAGEAGTALEVDLAGTAIGELLAQWRTQPGSRT